MSLITAKVIAHSISPTGDEIVTFEVEQPKMINAEVNTHRVFSRNGSSSRAIPVSSVIDQLSKGAYFPEDVRTNERGMQGFDQVSPSVDNEFLRDIRDLLSYTKDLAKKWSEKDGMNIHKQHVTRYLEPFMMQKFLITSTEVKNWFNLRLHEMAQPEIRLLAEAMMEAFKASTPKPLAYGKWHLPYVDDYDKSFTDEYPDEALVSSGACAAISYRNLPAIKLAKKISAKLLADHHMSPFEHQATPLDPDSALANANAGPFNESHISIRLDGSLWGGNFRGWGQLRGIVEGEH
jgi:thymidylate synthase ThyX